MSDRPIDRLLPRLHKVKQNGNGWTACCPAHEDTHASLCLAEGDDGRIILKCQASCEPEAVVGAIGWTMRDLFPAREPTRREVCAYDYRDEAGTLLYQTVRYEPKTFKQRRPLAGGGWEYTIKGVRRVLYRLPELLEAVQAGRRIYLTEGEKDADNVAKLGLAATTNVGGAKKWRVEYCEAFRGVDVAILPDNDPAGAEHLQAVAMALQPVAGTLRSVLLPGLLVKGDVSDWIRKGGTAALLEALVEASPLWEPSADGEDPGKRIDRNFDVAKIQKVDSKPPTYYVHLMGGIVAMGTQELGNYGQFCLKVMETLNRVPDMRNPQLNWRSYLDDCMVNRLEIIAAPEDASPEAMLWHQVRNYLEKQSTEEEAALAELRGVYSNERFLYFHGPTLHRYLSNRGSRVEPAVLWDTLRHRGAESKTKKVRDSQDVIRVVRAWMLPKEAVTAGNAPGEEDVTE